MSAFVIATELLSQLPSVFPSAALPAPERDAFAGGAEYEAPQGEVEEILSEQLATRVRVMLGRRKGRIVVEFGSREDLDRIVSEIIGSGPGMAPE